MSMLQGSYCCDEPCTPRVRTIFPAPPQTAEPASTPTSESTASSVVSSDWPGLLASVLQALLPFPEALDAARAIIRHARDQLPKAA